MGTHPQLIDGLVTPCTISSVASKETRLQRGRRKARALASRTLAEIRETRVANGISQRTMASELGISQPQYWRVESGKVDEVSLARLCEIASVLGLEPSLALHPIGDPVRDKGQQAVAKRLEGILSSAWSVTSETLLPLPGDTRSWDKLLRLLGAPVRHLVGVDIESRIYDIQGLVRRTRLRERDGGVDAILIVLSDSATNRRLADQLRDALGPEYASSNRALRGALRRGEVLPGSGVVLI